MDELVQSPYGLRLLDKPHDVMTGSRTDTQDLPQDSQYYPQRRGQLDGRKQQQRMQECWVDRRSLPWCLFPNTALRKCVASTNKPLWVCDRLAQELVNVSYSPNFTSRERLSFLSQVDKLSKYIGECERIHQTAVPLNYARHSLRSLTLWLFTLPFAVLSDLGMLTGPVMGAIAWLLLGVYQIGYTIEDPFQGSLRLSSLCDAIYRDVMTMSSETSSSRASAFALEALEDETILWDKFGDSGLDVSLP